MIIDMFSHIGKKKGEFFSIESMIELIDKNNVDKILICSQLETIDNEYVYESAQKFPDRTLPYAVINPWDMDGEEQLEKCFRDYNFYGVKFNAIRFGYSADRESLMSPYFELCKKYNKSMVVHCMSDLFSLPQKWGYMAKKYPTVPIVLLHFGTPYMAREAIKLAKENDNIYLGTCAAFVPAIVEAYEAGAVDKIVFSSDAPFGDIGQELNKVYYLTENQEDLDKMLYKNALRVLEMIDFKYSKIIYDYLLETPKIIEKIFKKNPLFQLNSKEIDLIIDSNIKGIVVIAHGSSFNAALIAYDIISHHFNLDIRCYLPDAIISGKFEIPIDYLIVYISQTGTSKAVVDIAKKLDKLENIKLALTDNMSSPLKESTDYLIPMNCGLEDSNAKTKGVTATVIILTKLYLLLGKKIKRISSSEVNNLASELKISQDEFNKTISKLSEILTDSINHHDFDSVSLISDFKHDGILKEASLKLLETFLKPAYYTYIEEFSHGTHRAITEKTLIVLIRDNTENEKYSIIRDYYKSKNIVVIDFTSFALIESCHNKVLIDLYFVQLLSIFLPELKKQDPNVDAHDSLTALLATRI